MNIKFFVLPLIIFLISLSNIIYSQANPDTILGIWFNEEKDAKIKIYRIERKYFGKIVWLKTGLDISAFDNNNPSIELRKRKKVGLVILTDFVFDSGQWEDGEIYDPKSGKTYSCIIKIQKDGSLHVRGYIGISIIGRTAIWTKAE